MSRDDPADLDGKRFVYVIQGSDFEGNSIHSIHATGEGAQAELNRLDGDWEVVRWEVGT